MQRGLFFHILAMEVASRMIQAVLPLGLHVMKFTRNKRRTFSCHPVELKETSIVILDIFVTLTHSLISSYPQSASMKQEKSCAISSCQRVAIRLCLSPLHQFVKTFVSISETSVQMNFNSSHFIFNLILECCSHLV